MDKFIHKLVKNCSASELLPILSDLSDLSQSTIYSDTWKAYDGLVDYGAKAHYRVKHSKNEFTLDRNHINGIENFFASFHSQLQAEGAMQNIDYKQI